MPSAVESINRMTDHMREFNRLLELAILIVQQGAEEGQQVPAGAENFPTLLEWFKRIIDRFQKPGEGEGL